MNVEAALVLIDTTLNQHLNNLQELIFRQAWEGKSYQEIATSFDYDPQYIKNVGFRLWQLLSKAFGEKITKKNFQSVLRRRSHQSKVIPRLRRQVGEIYHRSPQLKQEKQAITSREI